MTRLLAALAAASLLAVPAAARAADVAPGRVLVDTTGGAVANDVDGGGAALTGALGDGRTLLLGGGLADRAGFSLVRLLRDGTPDPSFGTGGVLRVAPGRTFNPVQMLVRADGSVLVVGAGDAPDRFALAPLLVLALRPDGSIDTAYGSGGFATPGIDEGCAACTTAAFTADGGLVLAGQTGRVNPAVATDPNAVSDFRWTVARLTPAGNPDAAFGTAGVATITTGRPASGFNVAVLPSGAIVTEAQSAWQQPPARLLLARLTPTGGPDPAWAGGSVVETPLGSGFPMILTTDGDIVVGGEAPRTGGLDPASLMQPSDELVVRYRPDGTPDTAFGAAGTVNLGHAAILSQLVATPAGGVLAVGSSAYAPAGPLRLTPLDATGATTAARTLSLVFGGGHSSFLVSIRPRPLPPLAQNSFTGRTLTFRPDGSAVVAGGVSVTTPTGEGTGRSIFRFAAAGLTPALTVDPAFGGTATTPTLRASVPRQRARTAHDRHGIRVRLVASAPGLCRVQIRAAGRTVAQSVVPVFHAGAQTLPVELTRGGARWLRAHRDVKVAVTATARDLFAQTARATAPGRLR